jgi:methionine aminopeptidase
MIILKTPDEIAVMAKASRIVAEALAVLKSAVKPGVTTDELDRLAESEIRARGAIPAFKGYRSYSVVTEFVGHGIGRQLHEEPQVPNYGRPGQGPRLQVGMVLAIEPMVNMGGSAVRVLDDRWTAVTADGSLSAHFEHTIAIQPDGPALVLSQL